VLASWRRRRRFHHRAPTEKISEATNPKGISGATEDDRDRGGFRWNLPRIFWAGFESPAKP
jgi:hypothetical protein